MPIPIQAKKKFAAAKTQAAVVRATTAQVGASKEELEKKYARINAENAEKLKQREQEMAEAKKDLENTDEEVINNEEEREEVVSTGEGETNQEQVDNKEEGEGSEGDPNSMFQVSI